MLRPHGVPGLRNLARGGLPPSLAPSLCRHAFIATRSPSGAITRPSHRHNPRVTQVRGKKTKTTVDLSDLPQGVLPRDPLPQDEAPSEPAYPTVVLQARRNMQKFDNCVLLTRVGGFYELYFEHADEYGPLLNLKVASKKTSAGPVPMVRAASLRIPIHIPDKPPKKKALRVLTLWLGRFPLLSTGPFSQDSGPRFEPLRRHC